MSHSEQTLNYWQWLAACSSVDIQTSGSAARTFWPFLTERMGPSSAPQMRATGSLVDLILILSCSRRSLYNFLWKPCEFNVDLSVVYNTNTKLKSTTSAVWSAASRQNSNETQHVEPKERKHEVSWLNYETVTFCCDSEFTSSSGIVMCPNSEGMIL